MTSVYRSHLVRRQTDVNDAATFDDWQAELPGSLAQVGVDAAWVEPDLTGAQPGDFFEQLDALFGRQIDAHSIDGFDRQVGETRVRGEPFDFVGVRIDREDLVPLPMVSPHGDVAELGSIAACSEDRDGGFAVAHDSAGPADEDRSAASSS